MPLFLHDGHLNMFVHIPKCAGQSVERHLEQRFGPLAFLCDDYRKTAPERRWTRTSPQHMGWSEAAILFPDEYIRHVFAVVRHPFSRLVSAFNYQSTRRGTVGAGTTFEAWFERMVAERATDPFTIDGHLRPQVDFLPDRARVFRLEDGLNAVGNWLDDTFGPTDAPGIRHNNATRDAAARDRDGFHPNSDHAPSFVARVASVYAADLARFGYDPAPAHLPQAMEPRRPLARSPRQRAKLAIMRVRARLYDALAPVARKGEPD